MENINIKLTIIERICKSKSNDSNILLIQKHLEKVLNVASLLKDIKKLKKWTEYRNEFTHSLYNKDLDDIIIKEKEQALISIDLSKNFDRYNDLLKGNINKVPSLRSK